MTLKRNKIFNPQADDSISQRSIIKGQTTGLFNLGEIKYPWTKQMYQVMVGNFWVPEKVSGLGDDAIIYKTLTPAEQKAYDGILSFLIFLDSIQTINIPNLSDYITSSDVNLLLSIQSFQEAIHSQSYTTILETVVDAQKRNQIYYFWREDKVLLERSQYIGDIYQDFVDNPTDENFFKAVVGNFLLEGLYFYNGFAYFDTLAYNTKMIATSRMINYIRRDELTHVALFSNIIKEIKKEFPKIYNEQLIRDMTAKAVEQEVEWTHHILGNGVAGITKDSTEQYTKYLANIRLGMLGLTPLYPSVTNNPYRHLAAMQDNNSEKTNFFESTVVNYTQASSLKGSWDF